MTTALLIIDIQNDYFPNGTMELSGATEAAIEARKILLSFRESGKPVIHIQHLANRAGATFFVPDTVGAEIHHSVKPNVGEPIFIKHFPSSFRETSLLDYLRREKITRLAIIGMMTHMCVDTTVRAAVDLGFECLVAHNACATKSLVFNGQEVPAPQIHAAYMAALNGIFAKVMTADELIHETEGFELEG